MNHFQRDSRFNIAEFLSTYWQQKPILIKDFFSNFVEPIEPEELAGLALERFVESRLVLHSPPDQYELRAGPFEAAHFQELGDEHWTLLVQAVDELLPEVAQLKSCFDFIPDWRIDDIMISFAAQEGGVGPHLDFYDVFLVQGVGSRVWKLADRPSSAPQIVTESGLKLLKDFAPKQEFTVETGDILYIPAGFGHWGVADVAGVCYSVGFRAPSTSELIEAYSDELIDRATDERYRDDVESMPASLHSGEIRIADIERTWNTLKDSLEDLEAFKTGFGSLVTQPRYPERIVPIARDQAAQDMHAELLVKSPSARFSWMEDKATEQIWLFVNGERFIQPAANLQAIASLCDLTVDNVKGIEGVGDSDSWRSLLLDLTSQGSLIADSP